FAGKVDWPGGGVPAMPASGHPWQKLSIARAQTASASKRLSPTGPPKAPALPQENRRSCETNAPLAVRALLAPPCQLRAGRHDKQNLLPPVLPGFANPRRGG